MHTLECTVVDFKLELISLYLTVHLYRLLHVCGFYWKQTGESFNVMTRLVIVYSKQQLRWYFSYFVVHLMQVEQCTIAHLRQDSPQGCGMKPCSMLDDTPNRTFVALFLDGLA